MTRDDREDAAPRDGAGEDRAPQEREGDRGPAADGERERADAEEALARLRAVHALDLGYEMLAGLAGFASQKLGLTPVTRPIRDLADARLAIELMRAGVEVVEREVGGPRATELRATLAQLQLAYVRVVDEAGAAREATAAGTEEASEEADTGAESSGAAAGEGAGA